jgi:hypothetical protein
VSTEAFCIIYECIYVGGGGGDIIITSSSSTSSSSSSSRSSSSSSNSSVIKATHAMYHIPTIIDYWS